MTPYNIGTYLKDLQDKLASGDTSEHTFRAPLENLIKSFEQNLEVINEPKRIKCGAPDLRVYRKKGAINQAVGYIEAKDIGTDLKQVVRTEQIKRYLAALPNFILTDYVDFIWFVDGKKRLQAAIADFEPAIPAVKANITYQKNFNQLIETFLAQPPIRIEKALELAKRMALLTRLICEVIEEAFIKGEASQFLTRIIHKKGSELSKGLDYIIVSQKTNQPLRRPLP